MTERLDFDEINRVALGRAQDLLARWLPGGRVERSEYVALNPLRVDRKLGSFRINISSGMWADFAMPDARGGDLIGLHAYLRHSGDRVAAARALSEQLGIFVCRRETRGFGYDPELASRRGPVRRFCSMQCLDLFHARRGMIDPTPNEIAAIVHGGHMGGEYLDSIAKTDLAALTTDEWRTFVEAVITAYCDHMRALAARDRARLDGIANEAPL